MRGPRDPRPLASVVVVTIVSVPVVIPMMIVSQAPALAFPVTVVEAAAVMVGYHPQSARVRWAGPVSVVPLPMVADRIPIAFHPNEAGSGCERPDRHDTRGRRGTDFDANRYLSEENSAEQEQEHQELLFHRGVFCSVLAISQVPDESIRSRPSYAVKCAHPDTDRAKSRVSYWAYLRRNRAMGRPRFEPDVSCSAWCHQPEKTILPNGWTPRACNVP
jgi:hypothetical protein